MSDQRTPSDMQDYKESVYSQLKIAFGLQIAHSQESAIICELLHMIARLTVALDDGATDIEVIQDCYEIARGDQPVEVAKAKTMGDLENESLDGFIND